MAVCGFLFIKPGGRIQGREARGNALSGKLPGRVAQICVAEEAGGEGSWRHSLSASILRSLRRAVMEQARVCRRFGGFGSQRQRWTPARKQILIAGAGDIYRQAMAASGITKKTYDRMQSLYAQGVVSEQKRSEG